LMVRLAVINERRGLWNQVRSLGSIFGVILYVDIGVDLQ
jgi:hypothetical protein